MAFLLANNSNKYNRRIEDTYIEDKMCTKNAKASEIVGGGEGAGIGEDQTLEFEFEFERVLVGVLGGGSEGKTNVKTRDNICITDYFSRRKKQRTFKLFENRTSLSKKVTRKRKSEKLATSLSRLPTEECTAILRLHGFIAPDDY